MQFGVVSDTHDNSDIVDAAVETFECEGVDAVVHCGDFVAPFSAAPFDGPWDFYAVRGNNDGEWALADAVDAFGTYLGELGELEFGRAQVAVYHGTSGPIVDALAECGRYDYVCHGHTHQRVHEDRDGTVRINPGGIAIEPSSEGPAAVIVDPASDEVAFHDLA
jgi:putative phosphoesterase